MPRIGVTGHTRLSPGTAALVFAALVTTLRRYDAADLHGVTCLAGGADQIFARAVLAVHAPYEAIIPAADYRDQVIEPGNLACFDELVRRAAEVHQMPFRRSGRRAFLAASMEMLDRSDMLIAVWDGGPSCRPGDSADVVATARQRQTPVTVLWPAGAGRR